MGKSLKEIKEIKKEFIEKYWGNDSFGQYMTLCGVTNLTVAIERDNSLKLKDGESLDDLCIVVGFEKFPPKDIKLPEEYNGVRVTYRLVKKFIPYKKL